MKSLRDASSFGHHDLAAHERMTGSTNVRTLEGVAARRLRIERHGRRAPIAFRDPHVDVRIGYLEAVVGVFAREPDLKASAGLHSNLRRRKGESLGGNVDGLLAGLTTTG